MSLATRLNETTAPFQGDMHEPNQDARGAEQKPWLQERPWLLQEDQLIGSNETAAALNISVSHLRRLYRAGTIPPPIRISGRKYGWRIGTIRALIRDAEAKAA